ncbi:MAG: class II D-tagatose-bisphosphate aldolase, non-catalytic subunit [Actinobacteria bacterium]|nr:class II D-tagatose-bisphosphate aldolase, non-catalytic subunit [Actinomycetota bacterium]
MEIKSNIDESRLRKESIKKSIPITDLLLQKINKLSKKSKTNYTLFAVCPNSVNVLKGALRAARRANAPVMFAATLNQVDTDGGYTGWTPFDLVRIINEENQKIGLVGPAIVAIDHGGPYVKDIQTTEKWDIDKAMGWTKKSFEAAILAGYDLIHVDPTVDIYCDDIKIETVADRTLELIKHCEDFRKRNKKYPISYEVGTEEVKGGLADLSVFKKFLIILKDGLKINGIENAWPSFVVGKVGTDLHTTEFDINVARQLVEITAANNTFLKGHYTDFVSNPHKYPEAGVAAANVGPEFTAAEYDAFEELATLEENLFSANKIAKKSGYKNILVKTVIDSNRWKKWLKPGEKDLLSINNERKEIILKTSARYVWAKPEVKAAQLHLYNNLKQNGYDPENWVLLKIEKAIDKYFREFNLIDLNELLLL